MGHWNVNANIQKSGGIYYVNIPYEANLPGYQPIIKANAV